MVVYGGFKATFSDQQVNDDTHAPIRTALQMAHDLHRAKVRKGNRLPYISHLLAVARIVLEAGADQDEAIAALLHDADKYQRCLATASRIGDELGDPVKQIGLECLDWAGAEG